MPSSKIVSTTPKPVFSGTYWEIQPLHSYYIKGRNLSLPWGKWFEASGNISLRLPASALDRQDLKIFGLSSAPDVRLFGLKTPPPGWDLFSRIWPWVTDPRTHGIPFWLLGEFTAHVSQF